LILGGADQQIARPRGFFPSAIETHSGRLHDRVNEVVSGAKSAKNAMTAAAEKANAAIRR
jgi:hypothetical protein